MQNHPTYPDLPSSQCCEPSSSCANTCTMVGCIQYTIMATTLASRRLKRLLITHSSDSNHGPKQHSRGYVDKLDMYFTRYAKYYGKIINLAMYFNIHPPSANIRICVYVYRTNIPMESLVLFLKIFVCLWNSVSLSIVILYVWGRSYQFHEIAGAFILNHRIYTGNVE